MPELLWLLLPIAAASGWYAATRSARHSAPASATPDVRSNYFKGLNYLLDEQPDKAIEVFIRMLDVDSETVETHLALGNLFRRRGEVDRAIRIHQNLVARKQLAAEERGQALLELGQDYMRAGLLDRAEALFKELVESNLCRDRALKRLTDIYQQEKDWNKAVESARQLEVATGKAYGRVISHYHCEQAEDLVLEGDNARALESVKRALDASSQCVRASLLEGRLLQQQDDLRGAVRAYRRVEQQNPDYLPEIVCPLGECLLSMGRPSEFAEYLSYILERYGGITATLALAEMKAEERGDEDAIAFLTGQLRHRPSVRGLNRLIGMAMDHVEGAAGDYLNILKDLTDKLLEGRPVYVCKHCGFSGKTLHWQCPSCKYWGTVTPIHGVDGE